MSALRWVWKHLAMVASAIVAVLLGVLAWGAYERKVGKLKDSIKVEKAKGQIAGLQARRKALIENAEGKQAEIQEVDRKLVENKRAIVEATEEVKDLTDDEIEDEFRRLGY